MLVAAISSSGCDQDKDQVLTGSSHDWVIRTDEDDKELQLATQKAKDTVEEFIAAISDEKALDANEENVDRVKRKFFVKKRFENEEHVELMWLKDVTIEGGAFVGKLNNDPGNVDAKVGDKCVVARDEIVDWQIVQGDTSLGGFTTTVLKNRAASARAK